MLILGLSGRKQAGKSTAGNFIYSLYMSEYNISKEVYIDGYGRIVVSDLLGNEDYAGIFDPTLNNSSDYILSQVFTKLNRLVKIYNFADPLKQLCVDILGLEPKQCYGSDKDKNELVNCYWEEKQLTAREVLQIVGTDMLRKIQKNVWSDATIRRIKKDSPKLAIITDCRFPNEVEAIKNAGGKIIRLTRNLYNSDHTSESILDKENYDWNNFNFVIDNQELELLDNLIEIKTILGKLQNDNNIL